MARPRKTTTVTEEPIEPPQEDTQLTAQTLREMEAGRAVLAALAASQPAAAPVVEPEPASESAPDPAPDPTAPTE